MTVEQQDSMFEQVDEVIEKLRPFLLRDGGDCELVDVEDGAWACSTSTK